MISKSECIKLLQSCADILRERFEVRTMCLFGSVARDEQKDTSDVDICVEMTPKFYKIYRIRFIP